jgi:hypothetical protein
MNPYDYDFDLIIFKNDFERILRLGKELVPIGIEVSRTGQIFYSSPDSQHRNVMDYMTVDEDKREYYAPLRRHMFVGYNVSIPGDPHLHLETGMNFKYGSREDYTTTIQVCIHFYIYSSYFHIFESFGQLLEGHTVHSHPPLFFVY